MKITIEQDDGSKIIYVFPTCCNSACKENPTGHIVMALCAEHQKEMIEFLNFKIAENFTQKPLFFSPN